MVTRLVTAPRIEFEGLRCELELPTQFPLAAQREADKVADRVLAELSVEAASQSAVDRTAILFVTIDPATSRDLDQALCLQRRPHGYRVYYAIADVTAFVPHGGELEAETWRRGQTIYLPDGKVPLHPLTLSEGAGSLLPGETRPAALWTIDLDADGVLTEVRLERAVVRSRVKLDYASVQAAADQGTLNESIALLPEIGRLLVGRGLDRGAINLPIPEQEIEIDGRPDFGPDGGRGGGHDGGGWRLVLRAGVEAEEWNAQISLLTGMAAAAIMLRGNVGLLRTMPAPRPEAIATLRAAAAGLGIAWLDGATVGQVIAGVDPGNPRGAALVDQAADLMRGAGYTAFDGEAPADRAHGAVAAPYAHVTAPLRRLADRYTTEVCLSLTDGREIPDWVRRALPLLPRVMEQSDRRASAAERGAIDLAEAVLLADRIGEEFDAAVLDVDAPRTARNGEQRRPGGTIAIDEPPVRARCEGDLRLGERVPVRLVKADPQRRSVLFQAIARSP